MIGAALLVWLMVGPVRGLCFHGGPVSRVGVRVGGSDWVGPPCPVYGWVVAGVSLWGMRRSLPRLAGRMGRYEPIGEEVCLGEDTRVPTTVVECP